MRPPALFLSVLLLMVRRFDFQQITRFAFENIADLFKVLKRDPVSILIIEYTDRCCTDAGFQGQFFLGHSPFAEAS